MSGFRHIDLHRKMTGSHHPADASSLWTWGRLLYCLPYNRATLPHWQTRPFVPDLLPPEVYFLNVVFRNVMTCLMRSRGCYVVMTCSCRGSHEGPCMYWINAFKLTSVSLRFIRSVKGQRTNPPQNRAASVYNDLIGCFSLDEVLSFLRPFCLQTILLIVMAADDIRSRKLAYHSLELLVETQLALASAPRVWVWRRGRGPEWGCARQWVESGASPVPATLGSWTGW